MEEYHCVPGFEEILGRRGATGPGGEVFDEADGLILERHGGAAGSDQHHAALVAEVSFDEGIRERYVGVESLRGRVHGEVVILNELGGGLAAKFRPWDRRRHRS